MANAIFFSVVIPLYNKRDGVLRAINSVLPQLSSNDEVIVVDDGSTDGSAGMVEAHYSDVKALRLFTQENMGVSAARNEGVRLARNDHVILLDADDWWLDGARKKMEELVRRWPNANAWSVGHYRADGETRVHIHSGLEEDRLLEGADFVSHYAKYSGTIHSSSVCIRVRSFFDVGGCPVGATSGEDVYLWLRLGLHGGIGVSPAPLVCIDRSLGGTFDNKNRDDVGYHYRYFADRKKLDRLNREERIAIKGFLVRNGLRQIAGSVASGNRSSGWKKAEVIGKVVPWFPLIGGAMLALPKRVFVWAFRRRHRLPKQVG